MLLFLVSHIGKIGMLANILLIHQVLTTLNDVLHYCDPHIEKSEQRGGTLLKIFSGLRGFNL